MRKSIKLKIIFFIFIVLFISILYSKNTFAVSDDSYYTVNDSIVVNDNGVNRLDDIVYSRVSNSFLFNNGDNTLTKVDVIKSEKKIYITQLDSAFSQLSEKKINFELDIFGAVYLGKNYNYIIFGQNNMAENNNTEVVRVVKYSKTWSRISQCSVKGINTVTIFDGGNCRVTESGNSLIIYTCHEMYKSSDGYNHQANLLIEISQSTMSVITTKHEVAWTSSGYVSHSFNQHIVTDGEYVYTADLGDAYPRGIALNRYLASSMKTSKNYACIFNAEGDAGENATGISIGGLANSDSNCLIAGTSVNQSEGKRDSSVNRNVFLTVTQKNDFKTSKTIWLTNNSSSGNKNTISPYLIKINNNKFLVMWELIENSEYGRIQMVLIDGNGNKLSNIITVGGKLSHTQPILFNNKVVWDFSSDELGKTIFFAIDVSDITKFNAYNNKNIVVLKDNILNHFEYGESPGELKIYRFDKSISNVVLDFREIPIWKKVVFSGSVFKECTNLNSLKIMGNVEKIPAEFLYNCSELTNVEFSGNISSIGNKAFYGCTKLTNVNLPTSLKSIGQYVFTYSGIKSIEIPQSVVTIDKYAFRNCEYLTNVVLPIKLEKIEDYVFYGDKNLSKITIPSSVKIIGESAFSNSGLTGITIPSSVQEIKECAFYSCSKLVGTVTIPSNVNIIGNSVFEYCYSLDKLIIKNSNAQVGNRILINQKKINVGETYKPIEGIKFTSCISDAPDYLKVDSQGIITGLKPNVSKNVYQYGDAVDYRNANDELIAATVIRVEQPLKNIILNNNKLEIVEGKRVQLRATLNPVDTTDNKLVWKSSNENVASVDTYGYVTAKTKGVCNITVSVGDIKATCAVTVMPKISSIKLDKTTAKMNSNGENLQLNAIINPSVGVYDKLYWSSSNTRIASVSQTGLVTTNGTGGDVTITVETQDGSNLSASCVISVNQINKITSLSISPYARYFYEYETYTFTPKIYPSDATNKTLKWSCEDESIATVDNNGTVTPKKSGNTVVKVEATDGSGKSATANIYISMIDKITLSKDKIVVSDKKPVYVDLSIAPEDAEYDSYRVSSSNTKVATAVFYGNTRLKITPVSSGEATISVTASNPMATASLKITVLEDTGLPFKDISSSDWFLNAVKYTYENKMISGYSADTFVPYDKVTRAMFVTMLYNMSGRPYNNGQSAFSDVKNNEWYSQAIKWAYDNKIVSGYSGTTKFGPNDNILRQDLTVILRNYANYKKKNTNRIYDLKKFPDYKLIDGYANSSIQWAVSTGVMTGNANGTINPKGYATRAEAAALLQKYCLSIGK